MQPNPQSFTSRESWPPGTVIKDDYVIESRLGKGGFGTVYKARHRFLQSTHVIKRLHEEYSSDEEYVRKFINEGQVIRRLKDCPYIVEVEHMTLTADQHLILIMEYMPGGDLNGLMQERRFLTIAEVAGYIVQIAEGLRAAHAIDLIHRDVKPHNVLLAENKRKAKLTDFGIAADHHSAMATSVVRGGSLGYAAPEQWTTAGRNLDARADIYSLGVTMYQMLAGVMPYSATDIGGWIDAVRTTQPSYVNWLREDVPEDLNRLVMQMIEVRREHRPESIDEVVERMSPYADPVEWNRTPSRVPDRAHRPEPLSNQTPSNQTPPVPTPATAPTLPPRQQPTVPPPPSPPPPTPSNPVPSNQAPPEPPSRGSYTPTQFMPVAQQQPPPPQTQAYAPGQQFAPQPQPPYSPQPQFVPPQQYPGATPPQAHGFQPQNFKQPHNFPPPPPGQQAWTQPPMQQPPPAKSGVGKWLIIVPLVLAALGGGGWYGYQLYHPESKPSNGDKNEPAADWLQKGDEARDRGDYHEALSCYRKQPSGVARIQAVQTLVEPDVEAKVGKFSDVGQFDKADALVTEWLAEFPTSDRLKAQKDLIARRRQAQ